MATCIYNCIPVNGQGGKLTGRGLGGPTTLSQGEYLTVTVNWQGNTTPPSTMNGYFIFSAAGDASSSQVAPSPFLNGSNYTCLLVQTVSGTGSGSGQFNFPGVMYAGNVPGTFVVTAAPTAGSNQTNVSPFLLTTGGPQCVSNPQTVSGVSGTDTTVYTFPLLTYLGGYVGKYELTFIVANNTVSPPVQWSEDPEFDTSS